MKNVLKHSLENLYRYLWILPVFLIGLSSCQGERPSAKRSVVNHEKIDALFNKDVSQVLFDHLYVVLDSITYIQLTKKNSWINSYASIDEGLPNFDAINEKSTSCYLRGHKHYIELLGPDNEYQEPVGKSGVGFSLRNQGEHFHLGVQPKLKKSGTPYLSISETVAMPVGKQKATWFKAFYSPSTETALHTWYAFYNPGFLDSLYHKEHDGYSREVFLHKSYKKEHLFQGIHGISITCTPKDYERIAQEMRHLGCSLLKKEGKTLTIASGDISINLTPSDTVKFSRITEIKCGLNASNNNVTKMGNLMITNNGTESVWNFENLYNNYP